MGTDETGAAAETGAGVDAPPAWATWHARSVACRVAGGAQADQLVVGGGRMWLYRGGQAAFVAPDDWLVSDAAACDLDGDGADEVVLLVWRRGSYGQSRPFWVERDDEGFSQHVFVLGWKADGAGGAGVRDAGADDVWGGTLAPRWMSSKLGVEVARMRLGTDGLLQLTARDGGLTRWRWGSWGFELVQSVPAGEAVAVRTATLLAVGDNIAHELVYEGAWDPQARAFDFGPIYEPVRGLVAAADLAAVGQETVLVREPALRSGYPLFATPCAMGDALAQAGFDAVLAASNHVNDKGATGLEDTLRFWEQEHPEVLVLGLRRAEVGEGDGPAGDDAARQLDVVELAGARVALFDYTFGLNGRPLPDDSPYRVDVLDDAGVFRLEADLARARAEADFAVCFLHVGAEYQREPTAEQRALAERLVDAGAGLVVCAHAHVLAPYERLRTARGNEGVVFWGLGNFVAVQDDVACALGGAALVTLEASASAGCPSVRVADCELLPTVCHVARSGAVEVWQLADYTAEQAAEHYLNDLGQQVTVDGLWELYALQTALLA